MRLLCRAGLSVPVGAFIMVGIVHGRQAKPPAQACAALSEIRIAADNIGLPTKGAVIAGARLVPAASQTEGNAGRGNPPGGTMARPEYCEVTGQILPVDPTAPPIRFQVNLPTDWNRKALHMGGGGWDGTLVTGLGGAPRSPATTPLPITRGYVTFGSDGGHEGNDAFFALNQEALLNFAYGHMKKTRDVAMQLIAARYGTAPQRTYFIGQSGGGRQGLRVAQQFPQDYDGVAVTAPVIKYTNDIMHFNDIATALARPGRFLGPGQMKAFGAAVLAQCDLNDGVADGIVGDYSACDFKPEVLRCTGGASPDSCFSDPQLASLATIYGETAWKDAAGNVILRYPRFLVGGGEELPGGLFTVVGKVPVPRPQPPGRMAALAQLGVGGRPAYGNTGVRYLIVKDGSFDTLEFDHRPYAKQVVEAVKLLATDDPNLRAFHNRGGKLIILHNTSDLSVTPVASIEYFNDVVKTMGASTVQQFMRLYIVPGGDHGGGGAPSQVDLLGMIEQWVEAGRAPGDGIVAEESGPDRTVKRAKPLCAYPAYPRYIGSGDPKLVTSYRCTQITRPFVNN